MNKVFPFEQTNEAMSYVEIGGGNLNFETSGRIITLRYGNKEEEKHCCRFKAYERQGLYSKRTCTEIACSFLLGQSGLAQVIVSRRHVTGNVTIGIYLVDLLCTGVKDSFFFFNKPEENLSSLTGELAEERGLVMETCDYALAHNIIYSGLEFAGENGNAYFRITIEIPYPSVGVIKAISILCCLYFKSGDKLEGTISFCTESNSNRPPVVVT